MKIHGMSKKELAEIEQRISFFADETEGKMYHWEAD